VKTPCPWCKSNKYIKYSNRSGYKSDIRAIVGLYEKIPILCPIPECENKDCRGNPKKGAGDDSDKCGNHTFHLYLPEVWNSYPPELRERYECHIFTQVADGKNGELFVTEELCMEVLKDKTIFAELERDLNDSFERATARAVKAYANFTESPDASTSMQWPDFDTASFA
jgi:hypothetical protein